MGVGPSSAGGASARLGDDGAVERAGAAGALGGDGGGVIGAPGAPGVPGVPGGGGDGGGRSLGGACANAEDDDIVAKSVIRMAAWSRTLLIRQA